MRKTFKLEDLDCANCAAKMEDAINRMEGVVSAKVNFMAQSLTLEAPEENFDALLKAISKQMRKIEPDVRVLV